MATKTEQSWLKTSEELRSDKLDMRNRYLFESSGHLFQQTYGLGYWLYGVEFLPDLGWLAYEFGDEEIPEDHSKAIALWKQNRVLPARYFAISEATVDRAFENGVRKWGESFMDNVDLPMMDELIQYTLLGEIRYG